MNAAFESTALLSFTLRCCAAGIAVQSLEVLALRRELAPAGLLGWESGAGDGWRARLSRSLNGSAGSLALLLTRAAVAGACVLLPWSAPVTFWCAAALLVLQLGYNRRFVILAGNCETMFLIELFALAFAAQPGAGERAHSQALGFIALHAALAYLVAALHKLGSAPWRNGMRLQQIAAHGSYELPEFFAKPLRRRGVAAFASWLVMGLELAMPFAPFLPPPLFWTLLAAGFAFHATIAVVMGLHGFWWAFTAAYPALVALHQVLR